MDIGLLVAYQVVATGSGAGLVLAFAAHVAAQEVKVPIEPGKTVTVCYGTDSEPLLRLVTHALLSKKTTGVRVRTALSTVDPQDAQVRNDLPVLYIYNCLDLDQCRLLTGRRVFHDQPITSSP